MSDLSHSPHADSPLSEQAGYLRGTTPEGASRRFAVVASRFNERHVRLLVDGAVDALVRHGVDRRHIKVVRVPGAWEIPPALDVLAKRGTFDGLIALGVVIRGETPHFDYVCSACTSGVARVQADSSLPIGFGLLTCDTPQQAEERSGGKAGNKGTEAALATLEMVDLLAQLRDPA